MCNRPATAHGKTWIWNLAYLSNSFMGQFLHGLCGWHLFVHVLQDFVIPIVGFKVLMPAQQFWQISPRRSGEDLVFENDWFRYGGWLATPADRGLAIIQCGQIKTRISNQVKSWSTRPQLRTHVIHHVHPCALFSVESLLSSATFDLRVLGPHPRKVVCILFW